MRESSSSAIASVKPYKQYSVDEVVATAFQKQQIPQITNDLRTWCPKI